MQSLSLPQFQIQRYHRYVSRWYRRQPGGQFGGGHSANPGSRGAISGGSSTNC